MKKFFVGLGLLVGAVLVVAAVLLVRFDIPRDELIAKYGQAPSQFLTLPSGAVAHFRDQGNQGGPAIVLVHGSNASLHTWEPWVAELGNDYRVVSVDMPGHGLTGPTPAADYSRAGMVAFLKEFVDAYGLSPQNGAAGFILGGNSMGGSISTLYTLEHPEDVSSLILVSASGMPRPADAEVPVAFKLASSPIFSPILLYVTPRSLFENALRDVTVPEGFVTEEMVDRYHALALLEGQRTALRSRFAGSNKPETLFERVGDIEQPTLVLWGAHDPLIPVSAAYEYDKRLPNSKLVILEGAGHLAMEEIPGPSAEAVRSFLAPTP
ncbi:MAG: alpha/beta hydrolase [Parvibaculaceae bacterium]|nr:alpha/beta hydrolase [Parvibaculaceae bacterium]